MANYFTGLMDDPQFRMGLGLLGAAGPMPANVGFGQRLGMATGSFDEWRNAERKMKILEAEEKRRELDSEETRQYRDLQQKQMELAMKDAEAKRALRGQLVNMFQSGGQTPAAAAAAAPTPDAGPPALGPRDPNAPQYFRTPQAPAPMPAAPQAPQQRFPLSINQVAALKAADVADLVDVWKAANETRERKPGTYYEDAYGGMRFIPAFDMERGVQGDPVNGVRPIPGAAEAAAARAGAVTAAEERARAGFRTMKVLDQHTNKMVEITLDEFLRQNDLLPPAPQLPQPQMPQPAAAPARPGFPPGAPPSAAGDRRQIVQDELGKEEQRLAQLQSIDERNYRLLYGANAQPREAEIQRTQNNLISLRREMAGAGGQAAPQAAAAPRPMQPPVQPQPAPPAPPAGPRYVAPEQAARNEAEILERARVREAKANTASLSKTIDEALNLVGITSTGIIGAGLKMAPWPTDAGALDNAVKTVKANLGFDRLQVMRDNSKTGGAVGNLTERELDQLQSTLVSIDPTRDGPELTRQKLRKVKEHYDNWNRLRDTAYREKYGRPAPEIDFGSGAPIDSIVDTYLRPRN